MPGRKGSLQAEIQAAARRHGRLVYPLPAEPPALHAALSHGTPVLVFQNLGLDWFPRWHYAVLIGLDPAARTAVLHTGTERAHATPLTAFLATWDRAGRWARAVLAPDRVPVFAEADTWLRAAVELESSGQPAAARRAYAAATHRWPAHAPAWALLGNAEYAAGQPAAALEAYRESLRLAPAQPGVRNNRAYVLAELGCRARAEAEIAAARSVAGPEWRDRLDETVAESGAMPVRGCPLAEGDGPDPR